MIRVFVDGSSTKYSGDRTQWINCIGMCFFFEDGRPTRTMVEIMGISNEQRSGETEYLAAIKAMTILKSMSETQAIIYTDNAQVASKTQHHLNSLRPSKKEQGILQQEMFQLMEELAIAGLSVDIKKVPRKEIYVADHPIRLMLTEERTRMGLTRRSANRLVGPDDDYDNPLEEIGEDIVEW